jgi:hypothetical protein
VLHARNPGIERLRETTAELGYAATDHVAQSRTVHTGLTVITGTEDRQHWRVPFDGRPGELDWAGAVVAAN